MLKIGRKKYLAVTTVTHKGVLLNQPAETVVHLNSSEEEADTHKTGYNVHIMMHRTQMSWFWQFQRLKN